MDEIIDYVMETPGNTNPNVLRGMLNNSGGNLPPVTSDDNGDVLTVVSGEWAKATPAGGVLVVNATMDSEGAKPTITLDKTWQEIVDADFAVIKMEAPQAEGSELLTGQAAAAWPPAAVGDGYTITGTFMVKSGPSGAVLAYNFVADTANDYPVFDSGK